MEQFVEFFAHHWVLSFAFLAVLGLLIYTETGGFTGGVGIVDPKQVVLMMNHQSATVLDIRDKESFVAGHILGAMHFLAENLEQKIKMLQKYQQKPIIVVDVTQQGSLKMAALLHKKGFTQLFCLKGGLASWREAQLPLVKGDAENKEVKESKPLKVVG